MKKLDTDLLSVNLQKRISADVESGKIGGAAVCVMQNGKVAYKNYFGYSNVETGQKMCDNALFRMASMTKPITTAAVMILVEHGLLRLNEPISKYLPGFENMNIGTVNENGDAVILKKAERQITAEMLLSHSSGLGCCNTYAAQNKKMTPADKLNLETAVKYHENTLLDFEPGERECYSPTAAFDVLARIIEIISGMKFADFVKTNILSPLGMDNTTFTPTEEQWANIVAMHDFKDGKAINADMPKCCFADFPSTYTCGGAGIISSLDDYSKFAEMLLADGTYNNNVILSAKSVAEMRTPRIPWGNCRAYELWGLGVRVNKNAFYKSLPDGAYGWSGAYGTHFVVDTENKITAVYMKNSFYDGGSGAVTAANFEKDIYAAVK